MLTGFIPWEPPELRAGRRRHRVPRRRRPPVLVTLSTSAATNAQRVFERVANTLDELGLRGLFLVGDESNVSEPLRGRPGVWPFVPLHLVLPRCWAVVHSGSLGSTAAVLEVRAAVAGRTVAVRPDLERVPHCTTARRAGAQAPVSAARTPTLVPTCDRSKSRRERPRPLGPATRQNVGRPAPPTQSKPRSNDEADSHAEQTRDLARDHRKSRHCGNSRADLTGFEHEGIRMP